MRETKENSKASDEGRPSCCGLRVEGRFEDTEALGGEGGGLTGIQVSLSRGRVLSARQDKKELKGFIWNLRS